MGFFAATDGSTSFRTGFLGRYSRGSLPRPAALLSPIANLCTATIIALINITLEERHSCTSPEPGSFGRMLCRAAPSTLASSAGLGPPLGVRSLLSDVAFAGAPSLGPVPIPYSSVHSALSYRQPRNGRGRHRKPPHFAPIASSGF